MPTLHNAAEKTKKFGILLVTAIFAIIVLFWLAGVGKTVKERYFPTPAAPPTVSFGKLPKQIFPPNVQTITFTYKIDTLSGSLPSFPDRNPVRKIAAPMPTLLSLKKAQDTLKSIGFNPNGKQIDEWRYEWTEEKDQQRKLTMDILSYNFTLFSPQLLYSEWEKEIPTPDENAVSIAQSFATSLGAFPSDLDLKKTKLTYFSVKNNELVPSEKPHERKAVRVDFFQANLDSIPIVYDIPNSSSMHFLVGPNSKLASATFYHQTITGEIATYPIKTADIAFEELKAGKSYIASHNGSNDAITITSMYLAYYASAVKQSYLMPVFVFEGSDDFVAYVLAIRSEWIEESTEATQEK